MAKTPFFTLPQELRDEIYGYLLKPDPSRKVVVDLHVPGIQLSIIGTCKQIRSETLAFIGRYTFQFSSREELERCLPKRPPIRLIPKPSRRRRRVPEPPPPPFVRHGLRTLRLDMQFVIKSVVPIPVFRWKLDDRETPTYEPHDMPYYLSLWQHDPLESTTWTLGTNNRELIDKAWEALSPLWIPLLLRIDLSQHQYYGVHMRRNWEWIYKPWTDYGLGDVQNVRLWPSGLIWWVVLGLARQNYRIAAQPFAELFSVLLGLPPTVERVTILFRENSRVAGEYKYLASRCWQWLLGVGPEDEPLENIFAEVDEQMQTRFVADPGIHEHYKDVEPDSSWIVELQRRHVLEFVGVDQQTGS